MLVELYWVDKYPLKKEKRSTILKLSVDSKAYAGFDAKEFYSVLSERIKEDLYSALRGFESPRNMQYPGKRTWVFKILKAQVNTNSNTYPVKLTVADPKVESRTGHTYILIVKDNTIKSLMLTDSNTDAEILADVTAHEKRTYGGQANIKLVPSRGWLRTYNIEDLMDAKEIKLQKANVKQEDLPYSVKADYRKGRVFVHNSYGKGTVTNTSEGEAGMPPARGILDWVDVDFGKPYVKGGKLLTVRRISNVYASRYWTGKEE